jgi:hypothetical protein
MLGRKGEEKEALRREVKRKERILRLEMGE